MEIKPIRNDRDHAEALREIERIWGAKPGTRDGDRLDILITLVESYERIQFPIDLPDLSLAMIRRLHERLSIPAEFLIQPLRRKRSKPAA